MLFNEAAQYVEPDQGEASNEALLHEHESLKSTLFCALPPEKVVLFCPPPALVRNLK